MLTGERDSVANERDQVLLLVCFYFIYVCEAGMLCIKFTNEHVIMSRDHVRRVSFDECG